MGGYDVIVVGASVGGASTAALLGTRGFRVLLLDKALFPRSKVCGEGLMPAGVKMLESFGLAVQARLRGGRPFSGIRFHLPSGRNFEFDFSEGGVAQQGLAISRESLDSLLLSHAESQPGVEVREGFTVRGFRWVAGGVEVLGTEGRRPETHRARAVVAGDGIRSRFHRPAGISRHAPTARRFALRALFENLQQGDGLVDVFCSRRSEAYVAPMPDGAARVTLLLEREVQSRGLKASQLYENALRQFPALRRRMTDARRIGPIEATSPVAQRLSRSHGRRLLLVGDAGGAVDPVTGQGMTVALRDAALAAELLAASLFSNDLSESRLAEYTSRRNGYFQPSYQLAQRLLFVLRRPLIAEQVRRAIRRNRGLRRRLVALATETQPQRGLTPLDQVRMLFGV